MNPPLSDRGRAEAAALRDALRPVPLQAIYSSPLARARETTAWVIEPHGLPVLIREGLREIGVGEWEGLLMDEIEQRYAQALRAWWDRPHLTRIPGGETLGELRDRAVRAFDAIREEVGDGTAAVMGHGGVNKTILLEALGAPLSSYWRIRQANACINVLEYESGRVRVRVLNETVHLASLLSSGGAPARRVQSGSRETW
jgi:broad specificity phosphatase PhoE